MIVNILDYLEKSAINFPDKVGYCDEYEKVTFKTLKNRSQAIGTSVSEYVSKGEPVVVYMEKSVAMITAFLGTVYAGAFYVPLDVDMPQHRVKLILETLEAKVIISDKKCIEKINDIGFNGKVIMYEELLLTKCNYIKLQNIRRSVIDNDPLYAIFTSGSTGIPKGVVTSQRSAINFTEWYSEAFAFTESEVFGNQTPFYFDASVKDIYATLRCSATMHIIPKRLFSFPTKLIEFLNQHKINCIDWVPSALCMIVNFKTFEKIKPQYLRKVMFLGEVMPTKQFNIWRNALPDIKYANLYGPTEATGDCTYYKVERELANDEPIPIGYACENSDILILNSKNELVEIEEVGEICVRGTSLALGYYNNQEKTDSVFVVNPLQKHYRELIYRTGDLGKYNKFGEIIYIARKDLQIKHMGHRIELGEIETALNAIQDIQQVCCLYDTLKDKIVVVYVGDISKDKIINEIKQSLPKYMIPNVFYKAEALPINMNGKIDRVELNKEYITC